jgi:signal transduction histidine kinase
MRSSAYTLAAGYVALAILALVLFAAPLWYAWQVTIADNRAEVLQQDATRLVSVYERSGVEGLSNFISERVGLQIAEERMLLLTDAQMKPLAGNLPAWPDHVPATSGTYTIKTLLKGKPVQLVLVRDNLPGGYSLLVGRDVSRFQPLAHRFWFGLAAAVAVLSLVGVFGAILIRRAILSRIQTIRQTALAIVQGDLSRRLPAQRGGDELDTLSGTINRMLEQIEQLFRGVRNVSDSIAHDLRTPLAELRSRLEELSLTRPGPERTFEEIDAAVADVDHVMRIFNALLRLAEMDTGLRRSGFVEIDVANTLAEAVEFYLPAAELKEVQLLYHDHGPLRIAGDPLLLAQAIGNLIDNALKYAGERGTVTVESQRLADGSALLSVSDSGPGIPDAEKPRAAERFYRGETSRGSPGVGLGLSLVQAVAKLHGGQLELLDNHPGLRAQMRIPALAAATATPSVTSEPPARMAAAAIL